MTKEKGAHSRFFTGTGQTTNHLIMCNQHKGFLGRHRCFDRNYQIYFTLGTTAAATARAKSCQEKYREEARKGKENIQGSSAPSTTTVQLPKAHGRSKHTHRKKKVAARSYHAPFPSFPHKPRSNKSKNQNRAAQASKSWHNII